jgi:hypothetical protein
VLVQLKGKGFNNKTIAELDWDENVVWQWGEKAPGGSANQNHDWHRLVNGNTLLVASLIHPVPGFATPQVSDQAIYEVSPAGDFVWKWVVSEHLGEFGFSTQALAKIRKGFATDAPARGGFLTINK